MKANAHNKNCRQRVQHFAFSGLSTRDQRQLIPLACEKALLLKANAHNKNCRQRVMLKRTATDLNSATYFESSGNDSVSGRGRINADSVLTALDPQYKIRHIDPTYHSTAVFTSSSVIASGVTKYIPQTAILAPGLYNVDIIEFQHSDSYPFGGKTFLDAWPHFSRFFSFFVKDPGLQQHFYGIVRFNN